MGTLLKLTYAVVNRSQKPWDSRL